MMETNTMTLTEFLLARLAEDEARWRMLGTTTAYRSIAEFPLADVEAKRRIVERHARDTFGAEFLPVELQDPDDMVGICVWCTYDARTIAYPCPDLRDLASVYDDHPDYRDEWRP